MFALGGGSPLPASSRRSHRAKTTNIVGERAQGFGEGEGKEKTCPANKETTISKPFCCYYSPPSEGSASIAGRQVRVKTAHLQYLSD